MLWLAQAVVNLPRTNRALNARARGIATEYDTAMRAQTKTRTRQIAQDAGKKAADAKQAIVDANIAVNDNVAPLDPTGVSVEPGPRLLIVYWAEPPTGDHVRYSTVRLTKVSDPAVVKTYAVFGPAKTINNLEATAYKVEVRHTDEWDLSSSWTVAGNFAPGVTVAEEVDLAGLAMLGRLKGLLPNANLGTIQDATKLGTQVVLARAMAVQDAAALNLWVQDAAIVSAKIAALAADKIAVGTLRVGVSLDTGGEIHIKGSGLLDVRTGAVGGDGLPVTQNVVIDSGGLSLRSSATNTESPSSNKASKITPIMASPWASLHPFDSPGARGWYMRVDGGGISNRGTISLDALVSSTQAAADAASVKVEARGGGDGGNRVLVGPLLNVNGDIEQFSGAGGNASLKNTQVHGRLDVDGVIFGGGDASLQNTQVRGRLDVGGVIVGAGNLSVAGKIERTRIQVTFAATVTMGNSVDATFNSPLVTDPGPITLYRFNGANWVPMYIAGDLMWVRVVTSAGTVAVSTSATGGGTGLIRMISE